MLKWHCACGCIVGTESFGHSALLTCLYLLWHPAGLEHGQKTLDLCTHQYEADTTRQRLSAWKPRHSLHLCGIIGEKVRAYREGSLSVVIMNCLRHNDPLSNIEKQNSLLPFASIYSDFLLFSLDASAICFHDKFLVLVPLPLFINQIIHL